MLTRGGVLALDDNDNVDDVYAGLDAVTLRRRNHQNRRRHQPRRGGDTAAAAALLLEHHGASGVSVPPESCATGALFALRQGRRDGVGLRQRQPQTQHGGNDATSSADGDDDDAAAGRASSLGRLGRSSAPSSPPPAESRHPLRSLSAQHLSTSPDCSARGGNDRRFQQQATPCHDTSFAALSATAATVAEGASRGVPLSSPVPDCTSDDDDDGHGPASVSGPSGRTLPPPTAANATSDDDDDEAATAEEIRRFTTAASVGGDGSIIGLLPASVPLRRSHRQATAAPSPAAAAITTGDSRQGTPSMMACDTPADHSGVRNLYNRPTSRSGTAVFDAHDEAAADSARRDEAIIRQALCHRGPLDGSDDDDGDDDTHNGNDGAAAVVAATLIRRVSTVVGLRRSPSPPRAVREVAGHVSTVSDVAAAEGSHAQRTKDAVPSVSPARPPPQQSPPPVVARREGSLSHAPPEAFPKFVFTADEASVGRHRGADDAHGDKRAKGDKPCCVVM